MTPLREKMIEDTQLSGLSKRTQESYVCAVQQLADYYDKSPALLSEEEVRQYFLYLKNEKQCARSSFGVALCGIKFFYEQSLGREWTKLKIAKPGRERKLAVVLSQEEVLKILSRVRRRHYRVCLSTIYSCGLRLNEGVRVQVGDIDSSRMQLRVRQGKGNKDRDVPLPQQSLEMLRRYWQTHCHPRWLFPGRGLGQNGPMSESGVQKAFKAALKESGVRKAASVTLTAFGL